MYVFAEPVTEDEADRIQNAGDAEQKEFARNVIGVGKDDPKVQAVWQDIQDEVDEQVDEDRNSPSGKTHVAEHIASIDQAEQVHRATIVAEVAEAEKAEVSAAEAPAAEEVVATEVAERLGEAAVEDEESSEDVSDTDASDTISESFSEAAKEPSGLLMGWTLTVRSKVNGGYVDRPEALTPEDDWKLEYHIQEIPEHTRWKLYEATKHRRRKLVGQNEEEVNAGLALYRRLIQRYSDRGREWRQKQDELKESIGVQIFRPLGPGSGAVDPSGEVKKKEIVEDLPSVPS